MNGHPSMNMYLYILYYLIVRLNTEYQSKAHPIFNFFHVLYGTSHLESFQSHLFRTLKLQRAGHHVMQGLVVWNELDLRIFDVLDSECKTYTNNFANSLTVHQLR